MGICNLWCRIYTKIFGNYTNSLEKPNKIWYYMSRKGELLWNLFMWMMIFWSA